MSIGDGGGPLAFARSVRERVRGGSSAIRSEASDAPAPLQRGRAERESGTVRPPRGQASDGEGQPHNHRRPRPLSADDELEITLKGRVTATVNSAGIEVTKRGFVPWEEIRRIDLTAIPVFGSSAAVPVVR